MCKKEKRVFISFIIDFFTPPLSLSLSPFGAALKKELKTGAHLTRKKEAFGEPPLQHDPIIITTHCCVVLCCVPFFIARFFISLFNADFIFISIPSLEGNCWVGGINPSFALISFTCLVLIFMGIYEIWETLFLLFVF